MGQLFKEYGKPAMMGVGGLRKANYCNEQASGGGNGGPGNSNGGGRPPWAGGGNDKPDKPDKGNKPDKDNGPAWKNCETTEEAPAGETGGTE
jgi:hypothetical protein